MNAFTRSRLVLYSKGVKVRGKTLFVALDSAFKRFHSPSGTADHCKGPTVSLTLTRSIAGTRIDYFVRVL